MARPNMKLNWDEAEARFPKSSCFWDFQVANILVPGQKCNIWTPADYESLHVDIDKYQFADWDNDEKVWNYYMLIGVDIDTEEYYVREPDPESNTDNGSRGLHILGLNVLVGERSMTWRDRFRVRPGDRIYSVYEKYSDGSTFGDSEYVESKALFTSYEEADKYMQTLTPPGHGYFGSHICFDIIDSNVPCNSPASKT